MLIELERMNLMKYFLTSSASIPESYKVNSANGFIENLKNALEKQQLKPYIFHLTQMHMN